MLWFYVLNSFRRLPFTSCMTAGILKLPVVIIELANGYMHWWWKQESSLWSRDDTINIQQEWQGGTLWGWIVMGGIRMTSWFLTYIFCKSINAMNDTERQGYFSRLMETQGTWHLNAIHDSILSHGSKGKHKDKVKHSILNLFPHIFLPRKIRCIYVFSLHFVILQCFSTLILFMIL